jgi:hypothetical protein
MHQWVSGPVLQCLNLVLAWVSCLVLWIQYLKSPCWILSLNFPLRMSTHAAWIVSLCCPPMICIEGLKLERHYCSHQTYRPSSVHCTDWACHIWWNRSLVCNKTKRRWDAPKWTCYCLESLIHGSLHWDVCRLWPRILEGSILSSWKH